MLSHVYNRGVDPKKPDWVDFFKYQTGALITYWDTSTLDNDTSVHPGSGEILPVDAHPEFQHAPDGTLLRAKIQTSDATFSLKRTPAQPMRYKGTKYTLKGKPAVSTFNDRLDWWYAGDEHGSGEHVGNYQPGWQSVDVPKTGTTIRVLKVNKKGIMKVRVGTSS